MNSKAILLLNGVTDGRETYTEYLRQVSLSLPEDAEAVVINIPSLTNISGDRVSQIVNRPTQDIEMSALPQLSGKDFNLVISNEAAIGRFIDTSIRTVFIGHGSSAMPVTNPYVFGDFLSHFDVVAVACHSAMKMSAEGMSLFRSERRRLKVNSLSPAIRSDLRHTCFMPTFPMKKEGLHTEIQAKVPKKDFTIGLLPTALAVIPQEASLFNNLPQIIMALSERFPKCKIVFRPYPADSHKPVVKQLCETIMRKTSVTVDLTGRSSSEFYDQCDLVITDGSTGGVSFMLRKTVPPIYFMPHAALNTPGTRRFVDLLGGCLPMAHDVSQLLKHIRNLTTAKPEKLFGYYKDYCNKELFIKKTQAEYFSDILNENLEVENAVLVDAYGEIYKYGARKVAA